MTKLYLVKKDQLVKPVNKLFKKENNQWKDFDNKSKTLNAVQKEIVKNQNNYTPFKFMKLGISPFIEKFSTKGQKAILGSLNRIRNNEFMPHKSNFKI